MFMINKWMIYILGWGCLYYATTYGEPSHIKDHHIQSQKLNIPVQIHMKLRYDDQAKENFSYIWMLEVKPLMKIKQIKIHLQGTKHFPMDRHIEVVGGEKKKQYQFQGRVKLFGQKTLEILQNQSSLFTIKINAYVNTSIKLHKAYSIFTKNTVQWMYTSDTSWFHLPLNPYKNVSIKSKTEFKSKRNHKLKLRVAPTRSID